MLRIEMDVSLSGEDNDVMTAAVRLAQSLDLSGLGTSNNGVVVHRLTIEEVDA